MPLPRSHTPELSHARRRLGFLGLLISQALGAFNDNAFKMLILLLATTPGAAEPSSSGAAGGWSREWLLSVTGVLMMIPMALFSLPAGALADRFSKTRVLLWTKLLEILVMGLATLGFLIGHVEIVLVLFFLMALQSALYSPAKYGILPELLTDEELSLGNGLLELTTFVAIILGLVAPPHLRELCGGPAAGIRGVGGACAILGGLSVAGTLATLLVPRLPPAAPDRALSINPLTGLGGYLALLRRDRPLRLTLIGTVFFWSISLFLIQNSLLYADQALRLGEKAQTLPQIAIALGIAGGSGLAGLLSGRKVELGLVPLGAFGMLAFSLVLAWPTGGSLVRSLIAFALLGASGGFYIVPLYALLQHRSPEADRGGVVATANFFQSVGMSAAALLFLVLVNVCGAATQSIFLVAAVLTAGAAVYLFRLLPEALVRFLMWLLARFVYRIRVVGNENVPPHGPALIVCNHLSFVDGLLVLASTHRFVRFIMDKGMAEVPVARWVLRALRVIPISTTEGPKVMVNALRAAGQALRDGHVVCIFAEGQITRTGQMLPFRRGVVRILRDAPPGTPLIPVHLDRVWGSVFSFRGRRFVWKWPRRFPYPVTVSIGKPLPASASVFDVRQAVQELGAEAFVHRREDQEPLHRAFVRTARRMGSRPAAADSTGATRTYGQLLVRSILLARLLWARGGRGVHAPTTGPRAAAAPPQPQTTNQKPETHPDMVGILLPPTVAAATANLAALLSGRVPVNLNYTASAESLRSAVAQCGIRTVLTSRSFLERVKVDVPGEALYLEDLVGGVSWGRKLGAALAAFALPIPLLERYAGRREAAVGLDDLATVIFSSGSTGEPKGVMLTHANILSNIEGLTQLFDPQTEDGILGVLPFFHSFGFTGTLAFPLVLGMRVVYHVNPMDARTIGMLVREHGATYLLATPTFLQGYTRRCEPEDFGSLRVVIVGAEKLTDRVADAFREKFGIEPLEGYGCTECSPIVAVNAPDFRSRGFRQVAAKRGRIGHPIPGVTVRVVDAETFAPLPPGEDGLLLVKGPNVMKGYLGKPDATAEVMRDGWYVTGDIARMEEDGFVMLTDRLSRFSKIAGEMVPHVKVEEALHHALGASERVLTVTGVPDAKKGERLVVLHTLEEARARELTGKLTSLGLPNLWLPRPESFHRVEAIPLLGTGKTDLRKVKETALRMEGGGEAEEDISDGAG